MPVAYKAVALAAALLVLGLLFRQLVTLMLAVLMTIIIAIALSAGARRLERRGIPRAIGALLTLLAGLAVLGGVLALVIPTFVHETNHFIDDVPGIVDDLETKVGDITGNRPSEVGDKVQNFLRRYTDHPQRLIGHPERDQRQSALHGQPPPSVAVGVMSQLVREHALDLLGREIREERVEQEDAAGLPESQHGGIGRPALPRLVGDPHAERRHARALGEAQQAFGQ